MIVIFGASGQLGSAFRELLPAGAYIALNREQADFSRPDLLPKILEKIMEVHRPLWIINAAAYTQVDLAEKEEDKALRINAESPGILARWCAANQIPLIHFSTDYVFSGIGTKPWQESDTAQPMNAYGRTKLAGEMAILAAGCDHLIFRSSWIYDRTGKNFLTTMQKVGVEKEAIRVVADQMGAPTSAQDLARAVIHILEVIEIRADLTFESGIYHLCSSGETSWHGFAEKIFETLRLQGVQLKVKSVIPIPASEYPSPAMRPKNSRMDCQKVLHSFGVTMPSWEKGLISCLNA